LGSALFRLFFVKRHECISSLSLRLGQQEGTGPSSFFPLRPPWTGGRAPFVSPFESCKVRPSIRQLDFSDRIHRIPSDPSLSRPEFGHWFFPGRSPSALLPKACDNSWCLEQSQDLVFFLLFLSLKVFSTDGLLTFVYPPLPFPVR